MITSMCGFVDPWAAVVCGSIAGAVYPCVSLLLVREGLKRPGAAGLTPCCGHAVTVLCSPPSAPPPLLPCRARHQTCTAADGRRRPA
jgi:hypothetical protein